METNTSMKSVMHKNIAFTSLIRIGGRLYEFNFRKLPAKPMLFETDVTDAKGERVMFLMYQENDQWTAQGPAIPAWLSQHLSVIGEAIQTQSLDNNEAPA